MSFTYGYDGLFLNMKDTSGKFNTLVTRTHYPWSPKLPLTWRFVVLTHINNKNTIYDGYKLAGELSSKSIKASFTNMSSISLPSLEKPGKKTGYRSGWTISNSVLTVDEIQELYETTRP
jgi:hypothetical protein